MGEALFVRTFCLRNYAAEFDYIWRCGRAGLPQAV